jgi:hypothetical protein
MQLQLKNDLPFITVNVSDQGEVIEISNILIDTGSATSIISSDQVSKIHLIPAPNDILYTIRGVGGTEVVFSRLVDYMQVGEKIVSDFQIELAGDLNRPGQAILLGLLRVTNYSAAANIPDRCFYGVEIASRKRDHCPRINTTPPGYEKSGGLAMMEPV